MLPNLLLFSALLFAFQEEEEATHISGNSPTFEQGAKEALSALDARGFGNVLASPGLGSVSPATLAQMRDRVKQGAKISDVSVGQPGASYDVILQPGHYGRKSGATGTAGRHISEQQITAYVVSGAAKKLREKGLRVLVVPADNVVSNNPATPADESLKTKAFLAIHADGSTRPCSTGPSLAYPEGLSPFAMHAMGLAVSRALGYQYDEFRRDNFTANAARYYMFRKVRGGQLTGLLEIGELTCPDSEERLIAGANRLGTNIAQAVELIVRLEGD